MSTSEQTEPSPTAQGKAQQLNEIEQAAARNDNETVGAVRAPVRALQAAIADLQSFHQELLTTNKKLKDKLDQISLLYTDPEDLIGSTEIATLVLDRELRILHYTPSMQSLFHIRPTDLGQPIRNLPHALRYNRFMSDAEEVLHTLEPIERDVESGAGQWLRLRLYPYRRGTDRAEGVVFTLLDITQLKAAKQEAAELNAAAEQRILKLTQELDALKLKIGQTQGLFDTLFNANPVPTALTRLADDVFLDVNTEFLNYFGLRRDEIIGQSARKFGLGLGSPDREQLIAPTRTNNRSGSYEIQIGHPSGASRDILAVVQYMKLEEVDTLITAFIDITDRVRAEQQVRSLASELTGTEQAERHRLSQILHDDLQQRIFAIQMQLSFLKDAYDRNDLQSFAVDFEQLNEWLSESIRVTRQLSVDLSPPILRGEGLIEAVIWLAAQMNEQYGLRVDIKANSHPAKTDEKVRVLTFYAIRELLFNVVKHAKTLEAVVRFEHQDSHLLVVVSDRGAGFDSETTIRDPKKAHGLLMIRDRLNLLGCKMLLNSQAGSGTEAIIEVPYGAMDTGA